MPDPPAEVTPEMIAVARESRGLTLTELAERAALSPAMMSRVENGLRRVSPELLARLSKALGYPEAFFSQTDRVYGLGPSTLFHRKRQDVPNAVLHMISAQLNIRRWHLRRMLRHVEFPETHIPSLALDDFGGAVEDVARAVRAVWHLPPGPVRDLTKCIEGAGGLVVPFDFCTKRIDAVSILASDCPPLFFVSNRAPGDRLRFTLCHELGHIVMHRQDVHLEMERDADAFAAEFLMPSREVTPYLTNASLPKLAMQKPYWMVSMAALLKRAEDVGAITSRHARTLWMQMGARGYRTREPEEVDIRVERPTLYYEVINTLRYDLGYGVPEFAALLNVREDEAESMYCSAPPGFGTA